MEGTSATIVLLGEKTLSRPFVQYEICESIKRGNAIIGIYIHNIKDMRTGQKSGKANTHTIIGEYSDGTSIYFDEICGATYDYINDNGYNNLGRWVELAVTNR